MIITAIIVGIFFAFTVFIAFCLSNKKGKDFDTGLFMGFIISLFFAMEVGLISDIIDTQPTAMDVYQGKTTLEYTIRDSVKIDSIVIFKDSIYGK